MIIDGKQSIAAKNEIMVAAVYPPPNPNRILSFRLTLEKYDQSVGTKRIDIAAIKINNIDKRFRMPEKTLNDRSFLIKGRRAPMANSEGFYEGNTQVWIAFIEDFAEDNYENGERIA